MRIRRAGVAIWGQYRTLMSHIPTGKIIRSATGDIAPRHKGHAHAMSLLARRRDLPDGLSTSYSIRTVSPLRRARSKTSSPPMSPECYGRPRARARSFGGSTRVGRCLPAWPFAAEDEEAAVDTVPAPRASPGNRSSTESAPRARP